MSFLEKRKEEAIYINDKGRQITFERKFPFFLNAIQGTDGSKAVLNTTKGVNQDGVAINNVSLEARNITIEGSIKGQSKEELANFRAELLQVFNPKIPGYLYYHYGSIVKRIRVQVEEAPVFEKVLENNFKHQKFLIFLLAPSPYWEDISEYASEIALWQGGFEFELEIDSINGIEMGTRVSSLITTINNTGDVATDMTIIFKALGEVNKPSLLNINTREFIKVKEKLDAGDELIISTGFRKKKVLLKKNGLVENGFKYLDDESTFLQLEVGENVFRYDAEEGINNLEVTIHYPLKYLGV